MRATGYKVLTLIIPNLYSRPPMVKVMSSHLGEMPAPSRSRCYAQTGYWTRTKPLTISDRKIPDQSGRNLGSPGRSRARESLFHSATTTSIRSCTAVAQIWKGAMNLDPPPGKPLHPARGLFFSVVYIDNSTPQPIKFWFSPKYKATRPRHGLPGVRRSGGVVCPVQD